MAELASVTYRGEDGLTRVEYDFLARVEGDLGRPRLEPGKHTEFRWITESDVVHLCGEATDGGPAGPGNALARQLLTTAFRTARQLRLLG